MIRHVCMFKLQEENKAENIQKALALGEPLKQLPATLGGEIVVNAASAPQSNYDICLIFDFATMEDLDAYQVDPVHKAFAAFITSVREARACVDYEL